MKILGLSAGTLNGANDSLCKEALMAAKEAGADVMVQFITFYNNKSKKKYTMVKKDSEYSDIVYIY